MENRVSKEDNVMSEGTVKLKVVCRKKFDELYKESYAPTAAANENRQKHSRSL